ncbi:unnamed protein product [[Candida] boidinii]|uniref:Unnamed protein product n=1 Tax=Candida boidinii TaxID=5477 RepID=A0A9W6T4R7_CANBO|nr:hypothetical protein BVG19_g2896 [[Candida] boidinii]OWB53712.1 hypothetical protein B5S27_g5320 [[Candida] boidinii]OWB68951.1 hypothetical protein B5S30_g4345 [[Candida] boidinii]OWB86790.1 hypothetical protein B5S33_g5504 [[Candida] boidinii]GME75749.1 unnamed protein product [[Candida] boidinii]
MAQMTLLKGLFAASLAAVPLLATTLVARPTFANAIDNKFVQEELEKKRSHNYKSDFYTPNQSQDKILKDYLAGGDGKPREYTVNA